MRLGIDLDGVVADFNGGWTRAYNSDFGTSISAERVTEWDQIPSLTHFHHMGEFWRWARSLAGGSLFRHLDPYPEAIPALIRLAGDHDVIVVTTKPHWAELDTYQWLVDHGVPATEVHITRDKWLVDCDIFLDDAPHVLHRLVAERPSSVVCRFVRPWNHPIGGAVDITGWSRFEALVEEQASSLTQGQRG
jgi:5'(3')-deoxyribonucleotidase